MDAMTLKSLQVTDGSKIMLMASQGLHQGVILMLDFWHFFWIHFGNKLTSRILKMQLLKIFCTRV